MNNQETSIAANRKVWKNAVAEVLQKFHKPGIQYEIEPGITVDPLYSLDNAIDPIALPIAHIPQYPEVILHIPSGNITIMQRDFKDLALDKLHICLDTLEDIKAINVFKANEVRFQLQYEDADLVSLIHPAIRSNASAEYNSSAFDIPLNGRIFLQLTPKNPSDHLKEIILYLLELSEVEYEDQRGLYLMVEIGLNYAVEIAKLRALHLLIDHLWNQEDFNLSHQPKPKVQALCIVHQNDPGLREKGLIEMTTKCMAASAGMVHSLVLGPHSLDYSHPDLLSGYAMIPRILQHECDWFRTPDPMAGSYWIEHVTARMAETVWDKIGKAKRGN